MKVIIIEDERLTAEDLAECIALADPSVKIVAMLQSVRESVEYFSQNELPDLIFSDIQLGDGMSFEALKHLPARVPVIFCTAYDEYALQAFAANGVDYLVKPFTQKTISDTLSKYNELKGNPSTKGIPYDEVLRFIENRSIAKQEAILVYFKDKIMPIKTEDIAVFYIDNEIAYLTTFDAKTYTTGKTLEELENITGGRFYRANRKFLVNRKAVKEASQYFARKLAVRLTIPFEPVITVSKEKASGFLQWLSGVE